jgi:hypothetical protein
MHKLVVNRFADYSLRQVEAVANKEIIIVISLGVYIIILIDRKRSHAIKVFVIKTIPKPRIIILSDQIRTNGGVNFKLKHQPDKIVLKILPAQKIVQLTPSKFDFHFKGEYLASRAKG